MLNLIAVKLCLQYYYKYWIHYNEAYHNPKVQRKRIIIWYDNTKKGMEAGEYLQKQIYNAKEMKKRAEKIPRNDIRRYFEV